MGFRIGPQYYNQSINQITTMKKHLSCICIAVSVLVFASMLDARAEEGGGGHYAPGGMASFIDTLPPTPGFAVADYFMYYDADARARPLAFGGLVTFDAHAQAYANSLLALYKTPLRLLGGNYAVGLALPYVWMEVDGSVTGPLGNTIRMHDTADGLGDITMYPFMLGWTNRDIRYDVRLGVYAPSGDYEKGQLANVGKNYWTFEPAVSVSYLSSKIGLEASAFAGFDFNTKNDDTDYQGGDVFHLDLTVAEHLPLGKLGVIGVGANAFYYQQITDDKAHGLLGRTFDGFEGRTIGVGPVLSFIIKVCGKDLVAEVKWLPELEVKNRIKGDYLWFKLGMAF